MNPLVLVIDNYDSFTWNLVQYLQQLGADVLVRRNDECPLAELIALAPSHLLISPGPGRPEDSALSLAAIRHFAGRIPLLGVCLGHQALAWLAGGRIMQAPTIMHGKTSVIHHQGRDLFRGLANPLTVARYHSLAVDAASLAPCWQINAYSDEPDPVVMAMRHQHAPLFGVQFHPEAILSEAGLELLANFLAEPQPAAPVVINWSRC